MGRHIQFAQASLEEFRRQATLNIEALNAALAGLPRDRVRLHLCWGNYEGPHHYDVPLRDIIDIAFRAQVGAISFEAANPRHAHEWQVFRDQRPPAGMLLIPGVIESCTNYIEHPELIAERIAKLAELVGRERVLAGSDCGFGTWVGMARVDPDVVWAKFGSLAEGARLASKQLWA
jgi:5-methyltetrahydropteroyltriglutamate--homocysteine methyltransferase